MLLSKLSSVAEVFMPCPLDRGLIVADQPYQVGEFVRGEADVFRHRHGSEPELGARAMAEEKNLQPFQRNTTGMIPPH